MVRSGEGTEQSVRIDTIVSTGGWVALRALRMDETSSAPQERIARVPSSSVNPASFANFRICGCIRVLGSKAKYFVTLFLSKYPAV